MHLCFITLVQTELAYPANTTHRPNVGPMLAHRLRRRPNISPTLGLGVVFARWANIGPTLGLCVVFAG